MDIARLTGLDRSTVTHILNFLIREGLVHEVKKGKAGSRGGRCPILLEVNYDARSIIAIDIGANKIQGYLTSIRGDVICRRQKPITRGEPLYDMLSRILSELQRCSKKAFNKRAIIGVSCPGVIDSEQGFVHLNLFHQWKEVPVAEMLENEFGTPAFVENDANAAAMGELHQLNKEGVRSLVYLFMRESPPESDNLLGVGGALILNGNLWHGAHFFAGEVAQTVNTLFQNVMNREWKNNKGRQHRVTSLAQLLQQTKGKGSPASKTVDKIADQFGEMLSELVAFLDPEGVMIYLHPPEGKEAFLEKIKGAFYLHHRRTWKSPVRFLSAQLGTRATFVGIIALSQERLFVRDTSHSSWLFQTGE